MPPDSSVRSAVCGEGWDCCSGEGAAAHGVPGRVPSRSSRDLVGSYWGLTLFPHFGAKFQHRSPEAISGDNLGWYSTKGIFRSASAAEVLRLT